MPFPCPDAIRSSPLETPIRVLVFSRFGAPPALGTATHAMRLGEDVVAYAVCIDGGNTITASPDLVIYQPEPEPAVRLSWPQPVAAPIVGAAP